jgi:hypothetical protein
MKMLGRIVDLSAKVLPGALKRAEVSRSSVSLRTGRPGFDLRERPKDLSCSL